MKSKTRWNAVMVATLTGGLLWFGNTEVMAGHGHRSNCGCWGYSGGHGSHGGRGLFGRRDRGRHHDDCCARTVSCGSHGGYYGHGSHGGYWNGGSGSHGGYGYGSHGGYTHSGAYYHEGNGGYYHGGTQYQAGQTQVERQERRAYRPEMTYSDAPPAPPQAGQQQSGSQFEMEAGSSTTDQQRQMTIEDQGNFEATTSPAQPASPQSGVSQPQGGIEQSQSGMNQPNDGAASESAPQQQGTEPPAPPALPADSPQGEEAATGQET